jgi:hypothetical protein
VLYGFYLSDYSFTLDLPGISYKNVTTYVLETADPARSLQSFNSKLNGNVINWSKNANVPDLTTQGNLTSLPVTLSGYSQFFVVIEYEASTIPTQGSSTSTTSNPITIAANITTSNTATNSPPKQGSSTYKTTNMLLFLFTSICCLINRQ